MSRLRVLVLAPEANPESVTNPSVGYYHAEALARRHEVTLVVYAANDDAVRRGGGPFRSIEPIRLPGVDQLYAWALRRVFKYDYGRQSLTAVSYPRHVLFELRAWQMLHGRIAAGEFDVALRILPYIRVLPSPFAWLLRNGPIPFVIGPISGGLPWVRGFPQLDKQRQESGYWLWNLRALAEHMPFARSTYSKAAAIIAGSSHTYQELITHRDKLFFIPTEIGVNPAFFATGPRSRSPVEERLELIFVGRLIPLKACDLALRGAAHLLRAGAARFTVVGDGPERHKLEDLARTLGIENAVTFLGWRPHQETLTALRCADIMVFPSLREIGGGVVFEALGSGVVPVVADFGGPGDLINSDIGYKIPMRNESEMVSTIESVLTRLANDRKHLEELSRKGMAYARENLTWDAKAGVMTEILHWATGRGPKPALQPPERAAAT